MRSRRSKTNSIGQPLTREQEELRGRDVREFDETQLRVWLDACERMERWVKAAKARRSWKTAARETRAELARREARSQRRGSDANAPEHDRP